MFFLMIFKHRLFLFFLHGSEFVFVSFEGIAVGSWCDILLVGVSCAVPGNFWWNLEVFVFS